MASLEPVYRVLSPELLLIRPDEWDKLTLEAVLDGGSRCQSQTENRFQYRLAHAQLPLRL